MSPYSYDELCAKAGRLREFRLSPMFIAPSRRTAAAFAAKWVADQLGAPRVPQAFFCKQISDITAPVLGAATPGDGREFFVADGLSLVGTAAISGEEAHHALTFDGDEPEAKAFGRAAAAAWTAERYRNRDALSAQLTRVLDRCYTGGWRDGFWDRTESKSRRRLVEWYGGPTAGVGAIHQPDFQAVEKLAFDDLILLLEEEEQLDNLVPSPRRHLELRADPPTLPSWSFDRTPTRRS